MFRGITTGNLLCGYPSFEEIYYLPVQGHTISTVLYFVDRMRYTKWLTRSLRNCGRAV